MSRLPTAARRGAVTGLALALGALALGAALAILHGRSARELSQRRAQVEALVAGSAAASERAAAGLTAGDYDAAAAVSARLLARVLDEFVGYRQVTRRGNRFRITSIESEFRHGFVELNAESDFTWRLGLYDGPIAARYLAFARVTPEGDCFLYFRLVSARPLGRWRLLNRLLEPIVSLRMQRSLEIPDFRLPLGLRREAAAGDFAGEWRGVRVEVPARAWDLGMRRTLPFAEPERLGFLIEQGAQARRSELASGETVGWLDEDVQIAVRLRLLSELLQRAVERPDDIKLEAGRVENVYRPAQALRRVLITERVDIAGLSGVIDLAEVDLEPIPAGLQISVDLAGHLSGRLEGALLGLGFSVPLRVETATRETLPLRITPVGSALTLTVDRETLVLPLEIEAQVRKTTLRFTRNLEIPTAALLSAANLPGLVASELRIPTFVDRGVVRETKVVPMVITWSVEAPATREGFLLARGRVLLGPEAVDAGQALTAGASPR